MKGIPQLIICISVLIFGIPPSSMCLSCKCKDIKIKRDSEMTLTSQIC